MSSLSLFARNACWPFVVSEEVVEVRDVRMSCGGCYIQTQQ